MDKKAIASSEAVEAQLVRDLWANAPKDAAAEIGYEVAAVGDTVISAAAKDKSILVNRTLSIDASAFDANLLDRAIYTYERLGVEKYFIHVNPDAPSQLTDALTHSGLKRGRSWMKFQRDARPIEAPETELTIREIDARDAEAFGRVVAPCFDMSATFGQILAAAVPLDNWHVFMAFYGDTPAGAGCLITYNGVGLLDMGATQADFRRRGVQGAVMAARINKAAELGLNRLFTETGEAVEGEAQHSYGNILRYGFTEWYARYNYMPG